MASLAFLAFISLGLPDGVLGVAWPSVRRTFDLPLSALGFLLTGATGGYMVSSFASGALVARVGVGRLLVWSSATTVASALDYALAPTWPVMVVGAALAGLGAGAIDAGVNAYAAARLSPRTVNWLHASYGLGAMLGPVTMTSILDRGLSWRWGYGLLGIALAGLTVWFRLNADRWESPSLTATPSSPKDERPGAGFLGALHQPMVWIHMALFFIYTGLEVAVGQWTYSLLTEQRGLETTLAAGWVSTYWGSLALSRLAVGVFAPRVTATTLLRIGLGLAPVGALLLWTDSSRLANLVALTMLGISFAPIFPLLISETPRRLGPAAATHAVGFQIAAAYLGTASVPCGIGVLARWHGLEILGQVLVVNSVLMLVLHELALWWPGRAVRRAA